MPAKAKAPPEPSLFATASLVTASPAIASVAWTEQQRSAIELRGCSLLVSAAAGSGKTAVLAERCAALVCDPDDPCPVSGLLVVTFTEAAAAEMKGRIAQAIRKRIGDTERPHMLRQLALLDQMQVSTIHSFCGGLIRRHFHLLGLDPAFRVLDGDEAMLLQAEIARELFEDRYDADATGAFGQFIRAYGDGHDVPLREQIVAMHQVLGSVVDPQQWAARARQRIDESAGAPLDRSELGQALLRLIERQLTGLAAQAEQASETLVAAGGPPKYIDWARSLATAAHEWADLLRNRGLDALVAVHQGYVEPGLRSRAGAPGSDLAKALVARLRQTLKGPRGLQSLLRCTSADWLASAAAVRPYAHVLLELLEEFGRRYDREKARIRAADFGDLERLALQLLRDPDRDFLAPSPVARQIHAQFRHVLVDEYQDINPIQDAILSLCSRDCIRTGGESAAAATAATAGNFFCVGDVKQSIYRFRLAEPMRFLDKQRLFRAGGLSAGRVVDLQSNFRSRAPLLEAINGVFRMLMVGGDTEINYDASHELRPGLTYPASDGSASFTGAPIELHVLPTEPDRSAAHPAAPPAASDAASGAASGESSGDADGDDEQSEADRCEREAILVARRIRQLMGQDGGERMTVVDRQGGVTAARPIRWGDIVLLLRSMKFRSEQFAEVLRQSGIPVHCRSGSGYFDSLEVRDMVALLSVLDNQQADVPLATLLRSPLGRLPDPDDSLARIRLAYPTRRDEPLAFHHAVVRYAAERSDALAAHLRDVLGQLARWRELAQRRPLAELIGRIYDETGYLAFCAGLPDGRQRVANLTDLHDRAGQFGSFQRQGLGRFIAFLGQLQEQSELGQISPAGEADDVVRIMSVHKSKGLEFPVVFVADLGKKINFADLSRNILIDRELGLGMLAVDMNRQVRYPSAGSVLVEDRARRQIIAEELRVLYVAMTRAREHLVLIGTASEKAPGLWQGRWSNHRGPLPEAQIMGATSMLDWVGPVAAATTIGAAPPIRMTTYEPRDVLKWEAPQYTRRALSPRQEAMARLEPLDPPPPAAPAIDDVIQRICQPYPHRAYASIKAAQSATELVKPSAAAVATSAPLREFDERKAAERLALPRGIASERPASPTDIGTATHLVLQLLDMAAPCDPADIARQVRSLVDRRLIDEPTAAMVDLDSIGWFIQTPLGRQVRRVADRLLREVPVYFPMQPVLPDDAPPPADPRDQVMVRGRVDLLLPGSGGWEIADYKTDAVTADTVSDRADLYRGQLGLYRAGLMTILGEPIRAAHLVFLRPRLIVSM